MSFSLQHVLQSLVAVQGFGFAAYLLLGDRGKRQANRFLAVLLVLLAIQMTTDVMREPGFVEGHFLVPRFSALLYGPLFFLFTRALVYRDPRPEIGHALHGVPFLAVIVLWWMGSLTTSTLAVAIFASIGTYLALCLLLLRAYRNVLANTHSQAESIQMPWLRRILLLLTLVWYFDILSFAASRLGSQALDRASSLLLFVLLLVFVTAIVAQGLRQPQLFSGITPEDEAVSLAGLDERQGTLSGRTVHVEGPGEDETWARQLEAHMDAEQPSLASDLTIASLAVQVGLPARSLSRLINRRFGVNFSDFVNGYRIRAAEARLRAPEGEGETILELLYAVGFNSKSAFNAAFKRKTGMTPSQYRQHHQA